MDGDKPIEEDPSVADAAPTAADTGGSADPRAAEEEDAGGVEESKEPQLRWQASKKEINERADFQKRFVPRLNSELQPILNEEMIEALKEKDAIETKVELTPAQIKYQRYDAMCTYFKEAVTESDLFSMIMIAVIILAGANVGIQIYENPDLLGLTSTIDVWVQWIFVAEVVLKMFAEGVRPWNYFKDPWNIFDFVVVALGFAPFSDSAVGVIRLIRILRVLKLVRALPELQVLVVGLMGAIPSISYISVLVLMFFYLWAVIGVMFFGPNDPYHFGTLHIAMLSLWRMASGDDWTEIMYTAIHGCASPQGEVGDLTFDDLCTQSKPMGFFWAVTYHVIFQLVGSMMLLNLFIGAVIMAFMEAKEQVASGQILAVEVVCCKNLAIADPDFGLGLGSSDPYVTLQIGKMKKKTKVLKRNLNPQFSQIFEFWPLEQLGSNMLHIHVYDWDMFGKDDPLGQFVLDFSTIPFSQKYEFEMELWGDGSDDEKKDPSKPSTITVNLVKTKTAEGVSGVRIKGAATKYTPLQQKLSDAKSRLEDLNSNFMGRSKRLKKKSLGSLVRRISKAGTKRAVIPIGGGVNEIAEE